MTDTKVVYTGTLRRGEVAGTIVGELKDAFGWTLHLIGTRNESGGYTLSATVGDPPPSLRIPLIDDAPREDADQQN